MLIHLTDGSPNALNYLYQIINMFLNIKHTAQFSKKTVNFKRLLNFGIIMMSQKINFEINHFSNDEVIKTSTKNLFQTEIITPLMM